MADDLAAAGCDRPIVETMARVEGRHRFACMASRRLPA
jgi:hypothetical protein